MKSADEFSACRLQVADDVMEGGRAAPDAKPEVQYTDLPGRILCRGGTVFKEGDHAKACHYKLKAHIADTDCAR